MRHSYRLAAAGLFVTAAISISCATARRASPCDSGTPTNGCVEAGTSFMLDSTGRTVIPGDLHLALSDVPEDSRCATGVQCVWAGRARVRLRVDSAAYQRTIELRTDSTTTAVFSHTITLDSVVPYPRAGQQIHKSEYRAWVRVTRQ